MPSRRRRRSHRSSPRRTSRRSSARRSTSRRSHKVSLRPALLKKLRAADAAPGGSAGMRPRGYGSVKLTIGRANGKGSQFVACAAMGSGSKKGSVECSEGRNPRVAVASALRKMAGKVEARHGGFAALGSTRRRRRKSRR